MTTKRVLCAIQLRFIRYAPTSSACVRACVHREHMWRSLFSNLGSSSRSSVAAAITTKCQEWPKRSQSKCNARHGKHIPFDGRIHNAVARLSLELLGLLGFDLHKSMLSTWACVVRRVSFVAQRLQLNTAMVQLCS
jgi:hypothetical protein